MNAEVHQHTPEFWESLYGAALFLHGVDPERAAIDPFLKAVVVRYIEVLQCLPEAWALASAEQALESPQKGAIPQ
jgi:hypothetical protein